MQIFTANLTELLTSVGFQLPRERRAEGDPAEAQTQTKGSLLRDTPPALFMTLAPLAQQGSIRVCFITGTASLGGCSGGWVDVAIRNRGTISCRLGVEAKAR